VSDAAVSEAVEILIAVLGVGLLCALLGWYSWYEYRVRQPRRDAPKVNAAVSDIEQHGVHIRPGEKLKPHSERWSLLDTAMKDPERYSMNPQRLHHARAQYEPWVDDIKKDIGRRSWWMSI
jgi:hypothetical protein